MKTLSYHGGKSTGNPAGKWIAGMLPWEYNTTYVEPFAGMLGILLQRKPVRCEIVNDLNRDIINWWNQVRTNADEMARLIALTPLSRDEFKQAYALLKSGKGSDIERAHALYVVIQQSLIHGINGVAWAPNLSSTPSNRWTGVEVAPLAERLRDVQLECRDALVILERVSVCKDAVVYCDPPYRTTECDVYGKESKGTDWKRMAELLQAQQGRVAVSGYGDDWDMLGWQRYEMTKGFSVLTKRQRQKQKRTEVLWCNFNAEKRQQRFEL